MNGWMNGWVWQMQSFATIKSMTLGYTLDGQSNLPSKRSIINVTFLICQIINLWIVNGLTMSKKTAVKLNAKIRRSVQRRHRTLKQNVETHWWNSKSDYSSNYELIWIVNLDARTEKINIG